MVCKYSECSFTMFVSNQDTPAHRGSETRDHVYRDKNNHFHVNSILTMFKNKCGMLKEIISNVDQTKTLDNITCL